MSDGGQSGVLDAPARPDAPQNGRPWLRAGFVVAALLFVALLAYGVLSEAPDRTIDDRLASGQGSAAPGFDLPVLQAGEPGPELDMLIAEATADGRVDLGELRGRPVVLNFWASWCEPCRAEAETLERAWGERREQGVVFVGLNMQDLTEDARRFMASFDNTYLNVRDESNGVARGWGTTGLPETYFVSPDGQVVGHAIGALSSEQLALGIEAAEAGRPIGALEGGDRRAVE